MDLVKNKKRAARRKRNFVAKSLIEDKQFRPKIIGPKKKRHKINVKEVMNEIAEEYSEVLTALAKEDQDRSRDVPSGIGQELDEPNGQGPMGLVQERGVEDTPSKGTSDTGDAS